MEESDENLYESEVIKGIGHSIDNVKLSPMMRKKDSGFNSLLHSGAGMYSDSHKESTGGLGDKSNHSSLNNSEYTPLS